MTSSITELRFADGVAHLTLQAPPCNEIGLPMLEALEAAVDAVQGSDARALVVSSRQSGFCAGADLRELHGRIAGRDYSDYYADLAGFLDRIHGVMNRLDALPLPTFGAIHGVCFGGGFELALTCDVLIADRSARFCFPELRLGLVPGFGGIPRLRREVSNGVVRDLLLTGRSLSAARAHELGLVAQVVGEGKAEKVALAAARQGALFPRAVAGAAKAFMKPDLEAELAQEKALFLKMCEHPRVEEALRDFVGRTDAMPYQPKKDREVT